MVLSSYGETALYAATKELEAAGHRVLAVACDVADEAQASTLLERAVSRFGRLDMAYNNAGILGPMCPMTEETAEGFDQVNAVILRGIWTCMKHELLHNLSDEPRCVERNVH